MTTLMPIAVHYYSDANWSALLLRCQLQCNTAVMLLAPLEKGPLLKQVGSVYDFFDK